jgi:hypothetical protein
VKIKPEDCSKTAFITKYGLFEFARMAFGLCMERFLGFTNYHRAFIEEYAQMAFPLQSLTGKRTYQWGDEQEKACDELRNAMVRAPVLALPNATDPFILDTDASDKSAGAELIQIQEGEERAVVYGSLTLTPEQQKYCTT